MQRPTCTNVRIRSTQDAHKIFYAIQQGLLHMVTRRLDADERLALTTGCVYAWEERGPHTEITGLGIERFTEGRRWSPSRVRDEFLFYYEKYSPVPDVNNPSSVDKQPPRDWDPLVKQTYSVWADTEKGRRKWHLTAYFTQTTVDDLGTVDDILGIQELVPPPGLFKSTRIGKGRGRVEEQPQTNETSSKTQAAMTRTYAPFPILHHRYPSQSESPPTSESVIMHEPYENHNGYTNSNNHLPHQHPSITSFSSSHPSNGTQSHPTISPPARPRERSSPVIQNTFPSLAASTAYGSLPSHQSRSMYPATAQLHRPSSPSYPIATPVPATYMGDSSRLYSPMDVPPVYPHYPALAPSSSFTHIQSNYTHVPPGHQERLPPLHTTFPEPVEPNFSVLNPTHTASFPTHASHYHIPASCELLPSRDASVADDHRGGIGPNRDLAPIYSLTRAHPYRRDPLDDKALRLLTPRSA